jgi:dTDP-4-dehydrorhamnose 3,5-epimerase
MKIKSTKIKGVYIINSSPQADKRGYFVRTFCKQELNKFGIKFNIVQANRSFTKKKGTIRGLHYQALPYSEDKIIQCIQGSVYNVILDLRKDSHTFGKWIAEEISEKNKKIIIVPKGCANGIQTLTNNCLIEYFMSEYYSPQSSRGIKWDDPFFKVKWPIKKPFLSEKDKNWQYYNINK